MSCWLRCLSQPSAPQTSVAHTRAHSGLWGSAIDQIESKFHNQKSLGLGWEIPSRRAGWEIPGRRADKLLEHTNQLVIKATTDKDLLHFSYKEAIATDGWRKKARTAFDANGGSIFLKVINTAGMRI